MFPWDSLFSSMNNTCWIRARSEGASRKWEISVSSPPRRRRARDMRRLHPKKKTTHKSHFNFNISCCRFVKRDMRNCSAMREIARMGRKWCWSVADGFAPRRIMFYFLLNEDLKPGILIFWRLWSLSVCMMKAKDFSDFYLHENIRPLNMTSSEIETSD